MATYEQIPVGTMVWAQQTANKPRSGGTAKIIKHMTWNGHVLIQWDRGDRERLPLAQISLLVDDRGRSHRSTRRAPDRFAEQPAAKKAAKGRSKRPPPPCATAKKPATNKRTTPPGEVTNLASSDDNYDNKDNEQQPPPPPAQKRAAISINSRSNSSLSWSLRQSSNKNKCVEEISLSSSEGEEEEEEEQRKPDAVSDRTFLLQKRKKLAEKSYSPTSDEDEQQPPRKQPPATKGPALPRVKGNKTRPHISLQVAKKDVPSNKQYPVKRRAAKSVLSSKIHPKYFAADTNSNKNVAFKQLSPQPLSAADCIDSVVEEDEYSDMELAVAEFTQSDLPIDTKVSVKSAQKSGARESATIVGHDGDDKVKVKWTHVGYCTVVPLTQIRELVFDEIIPGRSKRTRRGTQHFALGINSSSTVIIKKKKKKQQHFDYPSITKDPHGTKNFISQSLFLKPPTTIRNDTKDNNDDSKSTGLCTQEPLLDEGVHQNDDEHLPLEDLPLPVVEIVGGISVDDENYFASADSVKLPSRAKKSRISACKTVHSSLSNKPTPNFNKQHGRRTATPTAMQYILEGIFCSTPRLSDATAETHPDVRRLFADDEDLS